jgi:hypothetical protein
MNEMYRVRLLFEGCPKGKCLDGFGTHCVKQSILEIEHQIPSGG